MRLKWVGVFFWVGVGGCFVANGATVESLRQLPKATAPRFVVTDRVWPSVEGAADICLWKGDALAAVSYTIDDNNAPDHAWWIEQGEKYGFRFTWFVITERVGTGAQWGTWADFSKLHQLGHEIQSHSVTHVTYETAGHDERVSCIDDEYRLSQEDLEKNIPGNSCNTLAYPNGYKPPNDRAVAADYFIGVRGVSGLINSASQIDYMDTCSLGNGINLSTEKAPWSQVRTMLDPSNRKNYRGWSCTHFHSLNGGLKVDVVAQFEFLKENRSDFWVGLFGEVIRYGQERDTATVETVTSVDSEIRLSLS
ncbi:MAG: polysaccharide deacetylase family protein, partial [Victivallales bacterium]|nr:polysaccharide deacetylase family protein [Victivallales bacterium]